jgi:hypothetical protein
MLAVEMQKLPSEIEELTWDEAWQLAASLKRKVPKSLL